MSEETIPKIDWRFIIKYFLLLFIPAWAFLVLLLWIFFQTEATFYYGRLIDHVSPAVLENLSAQVLNRFLTIFSFMTILLFVGCVLLTHARSYRRRVEKVLKGLSQKIIHAHDEERENISREIHDDLGQSLATLKILIQSQQVECGECKATQCDTFSKMIPYLDTIIKKTRSLASVLRPSTLEVLGLSTTLETLINDFRYKKDLRINFTSCPLDDLIFQGEMINLYRIVQEALTNIVKHAAASEANIIFQKVQDSLNVTIKDNGQGFKLKKERSRINRGLGISTMAERTQSLEGTFDIQSSPGKGTTISVTVPVQTAKSKIQK